MTSAAVRTGVWILTFCLLAGTSAMAQSTEPTPFRLEDHRWEHRLLFVFAPSEDDDRFRKQMEALRGQVEGLRERHMRLITVFTDRGRIRAVPDEPGTPLDTASIERLRRRYEVPNDRFAVILVGKDSTEKRRDLSPVPVAPIFDTIDAMPMRQREMRGDQGGRGEGMEGWKGGGGDSVIG